MSRYLLDTNIVSEPLRPAPNPKILERLRRHQEHLSTASVVWHELLFGCHRLPASERRTAIEEYLHTVVAASIEILPYDERAARWHAAERARLARAGRTPPFADGQIAAVARTNDLVLITLNVADYAGFRELRVEDWRE
ncbi:MAG: type II toxin-antitoxin system VapC family toxin [Rubrobacteraceae bacterium]|nr:type II toxin-antitoxin system VapC family toxin [Rubrobacteraceae bacterium]MBA3614901.1 type II toxin-antitoxin system VapC family toxin [Rubrobacteraceae bacterium]MDQ3436361.1 type II toxin-antitoxin system VapC family toxin [Actinomycetota bacterium]